MNGALRHPFRCAARLAWLAAELLFAAFDLAITPAFRKDKYSVRARAQGMQRHARRLLRVVAAQVSINGRIPTEGLLVSNHLSYLDILVLGSITPAVFVSKSEVSRWPVLGLLTRLAGTLFVQRDKRTDVARINAQIANVLDAGVLLVIFPEGTSSDGREVLPFKSSLLEPAVQRRHALSVAHLSYEVENGIASEDACYWGEMTLAPHLLNLLTKRRVIASVSFAAVDSFSDSRKELARQLHSKVSSLKSSRIAASLP